MFTLGSDDRIVKMFSLVTLENIKKRKRTKTGYSKPRLVERENSGQGGGEGEGGDMTNEITNTILG